MSLYVYMKVDSDIHECMRISALYKMSTIARFVYIAIYMYIYVYVCI